MSRLPLISVIIPVYNAEKWLRPCCESVICQTYPNVEVIVVDDGSTDRSLQIAYEFAAEKDNVTVHHVENGGVCKARNIGMELAKGEYIAFLDADDLLTVNALEILYDHIQSCGADISIGWKSNIREDSTIVGCPYQRQSAVWVGTQGLKQALKDNPSTYAVWGKLYRKDFIDTIRFIDGKKVHEDSFFVFQCMIKEPKVVVCDNIVLYYRISANSASRAGFSEKMFDILYFAEQKKRLIQLQFPEFEQLADNMFVKANMAMLWNLLKSSETQWKAVEKQCIHVVLQYRNSFIPASQKDKQFFWIITHNMYSIYKKVYLWKRRIKRNGEG